MPKAASSTDKACLDCKAITPKGRVCWNCKGNNLTTRYKGIVLVQHPETSHVAKVLGITVPGMYALNVLP